MEVYEFIVAVLECIVAVIMMVLVFIAFVFYFSNFVEGRMKRIQVLLKYLTYVVIGVSLLIPLSGFPFHVFLLTIVTNGLWLLIQNSGFPFIPLSDPKLMIAFICTILTHFVYMLYFLERDAKFFKIVSYFFFFVWIIPVFVLASLCALDEDQVEQANSNTQENGSERRNSGKQSKSVWNKVIGRLLKKAETSLPITSNKND